MLAAVNGSTNSTNGTQPNQWNVTYGIHNEYGEGQAGWNGTYIADRTQTWINATYFEVVNETNGRNHSRTHDMGGIGFRNEDGVKTITWGAYRDMD